MPAVPCGLRRLVATGWRQVPAPRRALVTRTRTQTHQELLHGAARLRGGAAASTPRPWPPSPAATPHGGRRDLSSTVTVPLSVQDAYDATLAEQDDPGAPGFRLDLLPSALGRCYPALAEDQLRDLTAKFLALAVDADGNTAAPPSADADTGRTGQRYVTKADFELGHSRVASVDRRIYPITALTLLAGSAVGVVIPALPLLVVDMGISSADFGLVISALAVTKLLGNIPAANAADNFGRRKVMVAGLATLACGNFAIGWATGLHALVFARLVTGAGVAMFVTASTLSCIDLSTPINRARTFAPVGIAFSIGATVGPAIGGVLATSFGLQPTFYAIGGLFGGLAVASAYGLSETLVKHPPSPCATATGDQEIAGDGGSAIDQIKAEVKSWAPLMRIPEIRRMAALNVAYWIAFSGAQMTLLPLMLVDDKFGLGPAGIGYVFACMSLINVAFAQPAAALADRVGKVQVAVPACFMVASAYALLPLPETLSQLGGVIALLGLGNALLGNAMLAHVADEAPEGTQSKSMALMRSLGDVGMLTGAATAGALAAATSKGMACQIDASLLLGSLILFSATRAGAARLSRKR